ncbi:MAG: sigma 54-interacting transcriptional regulator [Deltaproteobacteria bacterium]|nr:sigma 54-interacting transcriptional regulator [Deltaproteobacteria bacterium]
MGAKGSQAGPGPTAGPADEFPEISEQLADEVTEKTSAGDKRRRDDLRVMLFGPSAVVTHTLPRPGTVTIGRAAEATFCVDDPTISRQHAEIRVGRDDQLSIRDLGSSNGTRLSGARLEPMQNYPLELGDLVDFGHTTLVVQRGLDLAEPRRLWGHGYFELRLEEECQRARSQAELFAVLRIRVRKDAVPRAVEEILTGFLSARDIVAVYSPSEYEVLLPKTDRDGAQLKLRGLRSSLDRIGAESQVGLALFPEDGHDGESLSARAATLIRARSGVGRTTSTAGIVIDDRKMRKLYDLAERVAASDLSILILGETGVGKEILATTIHSKSRRASQPFLPLNCGAFPEDLLESELFGHEKGAFTGAAKAKQGLLETAQGGTVFLDEIGEMPLTTQVKFLRVIEERKVRALGSVDSKPINVRFVAATHRDLEHEVAIGKFREDLFYRLNGICLVIPPLRERRDEIMKLAEVFAVEVQVREGLSGAVRFTAEAKSALNGYGWPGNVRELRNVIERAVVLAAGDPISLEHLPKEKLSTSLIFRSEASGPSPRAPTRLLAGAPGLDPAIHRGVDSMTERIQVALEKKTEPPGPRRADFPTPSTTVELPGGTPIPKPRSGSLVEEMEVLERQRIIEALEACGGNQTRAAEQLGMSRKVLISRLDRYGITRPRKDKGEG